MPITIKSAQLKYKNPSTGTYQGIDAVAETTTSQQIAAIEAAGAETRESIPSDYTELTNEVGDLRNAIILNEYEQFATIEGSYVDSDGTVKTNSNLRCSDLIRMPEDVIGIKMYCKYYNSSENPKAGFNPLVVFYNENKATGTVLGQSSFTIDENGYGTVFFSHNLVPSAHSYVRFNQSNKSQDNNNRSFQFIRLDLRTIWHSDYNFSINTSVADLEDDNIDVLALPGNKIYYRHNVNHTPANLPYNSWLGMLLTYSPNPSNNASYYIIAISKLGEVHLRHKWGVPGTWSDWIEIPSLEKVIPKGIVGTYTGSFTSAHQTVNTGITLSANKRYLILFNNDRSGIWTAFGNGNTDRYISVLTHECERYFQNDATARNLVLYNVDGSLDSIDIEVYEEESIIPKIDSVPKKYIIDKLASRGDYTSFTRCLYDLKDDHKPKIIEVHEGDYDIYAEYTELWEAGLLDRYTGTNPSLEYFNYCVWIPENTHIIGRGRVRLMWMPTPNDHPEMTWMQCYAVSPINAAATMTLENVEVHCKNGRYCIHNDPLGKGEFIGAVHKYINVKCYKYTMDTDTTTSPGESHVYGTYQLLGFGMDRQKHFYENCLFKNYNGNRAFYGHSRSTIGGYARTIAESGEIVCSDCIFDTSGSQCIKFGNVNISGVYIPVRFNNCYFSGRIDLIAESGEQNINAFELTFLNCGDVAVKITDANNQYPPVGYRTNLTIS